MATLASQTAPHDVGAQRPRAVSSMSYTSTSSRRSRESKKLDLMESPRDKKRFNAESKADPSKALNEATPVEIAQQGSTLDQIRRQSWKDNEGNIITDPDRSNPSRPRMERPLDTIRGFAAAAEGTASRRSSSYGSYSNKPMSQHNNSEYSHSRQGSYYNSPGHGPRTYGRQTPGGGYYRNNSYGFSGQQSSFDESAEYDQRDYYRPTPPRAGPGMRNMHQSTPYQGHPGEFAVSPHSQQQSYETMTSGSDENGKSTNPSSLNSSYDQLHMAQHPHARKPEYYSQGHQNQYENEMNFAPVSPVSPQLPNSNSFGNGSMNGNGSPGYHGNGQQNGAGFYPQQQQPYPPPPPKDYQSSGTRQPIRLNSNGPPSAPSSGAATNGALSQGDGNKRKSWLSRKLSRKDK